MFLILPRRSTRQWTFRIQAWALTRTHIFIYTNIIWLVLVCSIQSVCICNYRHLRKYACCLAGKPTVQAPYTCRHVNTDVHMWTHTHTHTHTHTQRNVCGFYLAGISRRIILAKAVDVVHVIRPCNSSDLCVCVHIHVSLWYSIFVIVEHYTHVLICQILADSSDLGESMRAHTHIPVYVIILQKLWHAIIMTRSDR